MEKIKLEFTHDDSVVRVILDDGKGNILDKIMMNELHEVFDSFKENNNVKLITFEGAGKNFSFGASVQEHTKDLAAEMLSGFHRLFYELIDLSIPALAKISGHCLGGGMELALACNFIFADRTAKFGQPEITLGVFAPPASLLLPLKIGNAKAEDLLITGKIISAEEAKEIGLLNDVYDDKETMESFLEEWINKNICELSASSLRYAVTVSRKVFNEIVKRELPKIEETYIKELMETNDANEGINSYLEKRKPVWKNC